MIVKLDAVITFYKVKSARRRTVKTPPMNLRGATAQRTIAAVVLAAALAACSSSAATPPAAPTSHAPPTHTAPSTVALVGSMSLTTAESWTSGGHLNVGDRCRSEAGYDDIAPGAEVVISDDAGRTLAITQLGAGHISQGFNCRFPFRTRVPAGKGFYGIEVTHRGVIKFPERAIGHVVLTLG